MKDALLQAIGVALDGLEVGYCAFDSEDRTLAWNKTFLTLFPEHDGMVHVGEGYADNLRRFYRTRLAPSEVGLIDQYIAEGVARHRTQRRPYEFDHGRSRIRVSSFEMGRFGRVRVWRQVGTLSNASGRPVASSTKRLSELNAQAVLERLADGVVIVDVADCVMWANKTFLQLYDLRKVEDAVGTSFESIYRRAWAGREGDQAFAESMSTLRENQRFSGAPFVLALPADRYVRVIEQRGEFDGRGYFEHSDITHLKRQQIALVQAERRYRLLAEFSSDIILSVEAGLITYASPALSELLGWSIEQVIGKPIVDFCHDEDVPAIAEALQLIRGSRKRVLCLGGGSRAAPARRVGKPAGQTRHQSAWHRCAQSRRGRARARATAIAAARDHGPADGLGQSAQAGRSSCGGMRPIAAGRAAAQPAAA